RSSGRLSCLVRRNQGITTITGSPQATARRSRGRAAPKNRLPGDPAQRSGEENDGSVETERGTVAKMGPPFGRTVPWSGGWRPGRYEPRDRATDRIFAEEIARLVRQRAGKPGRGDPHLLAASSASSRLASSS